MHMADVYLSLNGIVIPNNGYVEISDIGSNDDTALLCHTNQPGSTNSGGDWYGPDETRVSGSDVPGFTRNRGSMVVRLKRTSGTPPEGIYRCKIIDAASIPQTVYVGLYNTGEGNNSSIQSHSQICIMLSVTLSPLSLNSDLNGDSPQFTLTCISTGGPATIVTWTRDSTTVTEGTETVLDDPVTAQYTHTLTVTTGGEYTCTVSNNKPSSDSASITVGGI